MFEDLTHVPYLAGLISWVRGEPAGVYSSFVMEAFKWAEVLMTIGAAYATRMIPLRFTAMFGNLFGLAQGLGSGSLSTIVENAVNLPLNAARAREMRKLIATVREASKTDLNVEWLKPFAHPRALKAGASVFVKGEAADAAFILVDGRVELPEIGAHAAPRRSVWRNGAVHGGRAAHGLGRLRDRRAAAVHHLRGIRAALLSEPGVRSLSRSADRAALRHELSRGARRHRGEAGGAFRARGGGGGGRAPRTSIG